MKIEDLKPAPYNPRKISGEAMDGLAASLRAFGDLSGLTWNRASGNLVAGHQRLAVLKREHGAGLKLDGDPAKDTLAIVTPTGERFKVRAVEMDETTERAANIAANNPHVAGEFDFAALDGMLEGLKADGFPEFEELRFDALTSAPSGGDEEQGEQDASQVPGNLSYKIIVDCKDEQEQFRLIEKFDGEGLTCRVLIV